MLKCAMLGAFAVYVLSCMYCPRYTEIAYNYSAPPNKVAASAKLTQVSNPGSSFYS